MSENRIETLDRGDGVRLAFQRNHGAAPTLIWLSGFRSDMSGTKAETLHQWAVENNQSFLRLDYSGHGASDGAFEDGTIGTWTEDALKVIDTQTEGPLGLIGSSMGGWIALLIALQRRERVNGLLLLAPAPDFTEQLIWPELTPDQREAINHQGRFDMPSEYDPIPTPITRALMEDGRKHLLLDEPIAYDGPVIIMHGSRDPDVPRWLVANLNDRLTSDEKTFFNVGGGDHRLSRPEDLELLKEQARFLAWRINRG